MKKTIFLMFKDTWENYIEISAAKLQVCMPVSDI